MAATKFSKPIDTEIASLNEQIGTFPAMAKIDLASATSSSIVVPSGSRHIIIATTQNGQGYWMGYVRSTGASTVGFYDILGNTSSQSLSVTATEATRTITFTQSTARIVNVIDIVCYGTACTAS